MKDSLIEIQDISLAFNDKNYPEIDHVNLEINTGEIVSLVGPSGCGKSTLLRLITGVLTPDSGSIIINQLTANSNTDSAFFGFVPQDSLLLPWRTVIENVYLPLEITAATNDKRLFEEKAQKTLSLVNLSGVETKYPQQLSGGMKQRVALARALIGNPKLLLLDEPFAALDAISRSQLHLELLKIQAQTRVTILLVTHNIFEAVFLSQRVLVMGEKPGRILGEVPITMPCPRTLKQLSLPEFGALVGKVQELLETGWGDYYEQ
ncbi:MAG TPA: ABC transporter ATP-binding protein [Bacillota bacterium]|mgnify:CR=1 FL=1|nr:ABC transporter ATP-binding protein [Bacillota bacterium]HOL10987.1 ABC transporter ATP-binding protein [Bacillota bacterium]HPO98734.1 ABC transporter ATP-binding protein [Bacillota bacterium]